MKLTEALCILGFVQSYYDYSLFTLKVAQELVIVQVYVDDLLVTGTSLTYIHGVRNDLKKKFKMKDLGELRYFLGIEFSRSKVGIVMNQRKYALELVSEMGLAGSKPVSTSSEFNQKLTSLQYNQFV